MLTLKNVQRYHLCTDSTCLPIQKSQEVHDAQKRYDMKVDPCHQLPLRGVRWTWDVQIIVVLASRRIVIIGTGIIRRLIQR